MPFWMVSWTVLSAEPPCPNHVTTKKTESAIISTAMVWRQKPPGSSCETVASLSAALRDFAERLLRLLEEDLRVDFFFAFVIYYII